MWRALFLAIGVVLIIAGLECLVVGRFMIQEARLPPFLAKALDENSAGGSAATSPSVSSQPVRQGYGGVPGGGAGYASNRFGNDQFFAASSTSNSANAGSQFSLPGFGASNRNNNSSDLIRPVKILRTKDWMPWSLVAAGVIIVLYTNRLARGGGIGGD